jgi:hypothetical protein
VSHTISPIALAAELEANGPRAILSGRAWRVLAPLMRAVEPLTGEVEISHLDLAHRAGYLSTKSVQRALVELDDLGLVTHTSGGRVGHGSTEVRFSRVRVWLEAVETLLDEGREMIRRAREHAWSMTQARMRQLLDWRARRRARQSAVDNLAGVLDVAVEPHNRRSPVMDSLSASPPGPVADTVGRAVTGPGTNLKTYYETLHAQRVEDPECEHGAMLGKCAMCRRAQENRTGSAGAQTTKGGA